MNSDALIRRLLAALKASERFIQTELKYRENAITMEVEEGLRPTGEISDHELQCIRDAAETLNIVQLAIVAGELRKR